MNTIQLALKGASDVLLAGLVFGVGLPVVYALGMRVLTVGASAEVGPDGQTRLRPTALGRTLMVLLMAFIIGGVALGISIIVASGMGKVVSFEHVIPTFVDKKK